MLPVDMINSQEDSYSKHLLSTMETQETFQKPLVLLASLIDSA